MAPSVHIGIVRAAVKLLRYDWHKAAKRFSDEDVEIMVSEVTAPDTHGDRLNGRGMHYYCASTPTGQKLPYHPVLGGYCNGNGMPAPSPLTMMDGEYRAAIALYRCGHHEAAMKSLARALHMIADICCPPHSSGLTYFSKYAAYHKRYETIAQYLFWDRDDQITASNLWAERTFQSYKNKIPYDAYKDILHGTRPHRDGYWERGALTAVCNCLAVSGTEELPYVLSKNEFDMDMLDSIARRIELSIANTAALLAAFDRDAEDMNYRFWEENRPYWLKCSGKDYAVSKEPLYLHYEEDGSFTLSTKNGAFLAVSKAGGVRLTRQTDGMYRKFRFGREPLTTIYVNGDPSLLLMVAGGKLLCTHRKLHVQSGAFTREVSFTLLTREPKDVRFLLS